MVLVVVVMVSVGMIIVVLTVMNCYGHVCYGHCYGHSCHGRCRCSLLLMSLLWP